MRVFHRMLMLGVCGLFVASTNSLLPAGDDKKSPEKKLDDKKPEEKKPAVPPIDATDDAILRRANLTVDPESLLAFLRKRILPEGERPGLEKLMRKFGSAHYLTREKAMRDVIARGIAGLEVLRNTTGEFDTESVRRIESAISAIQDNDVSPEVPAAVVRALGVLGAKDLGMALIDFAPFADNDTVLDEIRWALRKYGFVDGKPTPQILAALTDRSAIRRACAAETLARHSDKGVVEEARKLASDPDSFVRWRTARARVLMGNQAAIPAFINGLVDLPLNAAWQTEDLLLQLAGTLPPAPISMGNDTETRAKCRDAWQEWWKKHSGDAKLAKLEEPPLSLGRTLLVLLDQGRVMELGRDKTPRWDIRNVVFPLDAQVTSDDRVLIAEYHGNRVTERDTRGQIVWQRGIVGPLAAQRLSNGNTFIATDHQLLEFDKDGMEVVNIEFPEEGRKIMKASKLPNGEILCMLADSRIARFDAKGKEVHSFQIALGMRLFGGRIYAAPNGRVLVPHHAEGKVVEYDTKGKAVWEVPFEQPIAAVRLSNGNTLITSMNAAVGAIEVDRAGKEIWSYHQNGESRVTRAIRR